MRTFAVAPACQTLLNGLAAFQNAGPGALPNPAPDPPAGLDQENAAFYRHLVAIIGVIRATITTAQSQALAEGQAAAQAMLTQSTP